MTETFPTRSVNLTEAVLNGLYSDFTVVIKGKVYLLHKIVLGDYSGFFNGLFRNQPNQDRIDFDDDHVMAQDVTIWEHVVAKWYRNGSYRPVRYHSFDYQTVVSNYKVVCEYLSTPIPSIKFAHKQKFLPPGTSVVYNGKDDTITTIINGITRKWDNVKTLCDSGDRYTTSRSPMTESMIEVVAVLNEAIKSNSNGRCVDLLYYLAAVDISDPTCYGDRNPIFKINNSGVSCNWHKNDDAISSTDDIENCLRQSLPHADWW